MHGVINQPWVHSSREQEEEEEEENVTHAHKLAFLICFRLEWSIILQSY